MVSIELPLSSYSLTTIHAVRSSWGFFGYAHPPKTYQLLQNNALAPEQRIRRFHERATEWLPDGDPIQADDTPESASSLKSMTLGRTQTKMTG